MGSKLISLISNHDPLITPSKLLILDFEAEANVEVALVWVTAQTLLYMWGIRCNGKIVNPTLTRAALESKICLLRETRFRNENTIIKVSTPVGITGETSTAETVGQGTTEGAILSAVSIGGGVEEYFGDSSYEVWYDKVRLQPGVFQDDVARMAGGRMEAQVGNNLMEMVAESKLLSFNLDKSAFMVIGTKKNKKELETELEKSPLVLSRQNMKRVSEYTYLGTVISERGVGESVTASIKSKVGKVKQLIYEIKAVVEDCRNDAPGGFCTAVHIWEAAVIPYLYNASECWLSSTAYRRPS